MASRCWNTAESTRVEFFGSLFLVTSREALRLSSCLDLRVVEAVRFKHHNLIVALIVRIFRMRSNPAL